MIMTLEPCPADPKHEMEVNHDGIVMSSDISVVIICSADHPEKSGSSESSVLHTLHCCLPVASRNRRWPAGVTRTTPTTPKSCDGISILDGWGNEVNVLTYPINSVMGGPCTTISHVMTEHPISALHCDMFIECSFRPAASSQLFQSR